MLEISLDCVLDKNRVRGVLIRSDGKLFCRDLPSGFIVCVARAALWPARPRYYDKDLQTDFYLFTRCTDTGVIATHALSFYRPLAPLLLLTHAQLAVVTQSCALLYNYCAL